MRLYQTPDGGWHPTKDAWTQAMKANEYDPDEWADKAVVDVPVSKNELLEWLTFNRINVVNPGNAGNPGFVVRQLSYTEHSVMSDRLFGSLPLGQQLTLAGVAIENAYKQVKE